MSYALFGSSNLKLLILVPFGGTRWGLWCVAGIHGTCPAMQRAFFKMSRLKILPREQLKHVYIYSAELCPITSLGCNLNFRV